MSCALFWQVMCWAFREMVVKCSDGTPTSTHEGGLCPPSALKRVSCHQEPLSTPQAYHLSDSHWPDLSRLLQIHQARSFLLAVPRCLECLPLTDLH